MHVTGSEKGITAAGKFQASDGVGLHVLAIESYCLETWPIGVLTDARHHESAKNLAGPVQGLGCLRL